MTSVSSEPATLAARTYRRRWWLAGGLTVAVLALAITPPLVNVNRYRRRVAASMGQSLGRPVHLDNVTLSLLPVPHLTLQNLVVSEDPAFGNEPTIRADVVEATLRASSLWRRRMEFSRVRFVEPSVNLVRNAEGRWNLEEVLTHASRIDIAPTVQERAGSAPRFPYIEATGGRVNIKLGDVKKPFSLVDADFALWLPYPQQWHIRLIGKPARTDTNLTDPGVMRLEGTLDRALHMKEVPVDLHASWHDAPLGEASRLLTGDDMGWRGTLHLDASMKGSLGAGRLSTQLTVDDLRRADFIPLHPLSLQANCVALADSPMAELSNLACTVPAGGSQPLALQAEHLDLHRPQDASFTVQSRETPLDWFLGWGRLLSPRTAKTGAQPGTVMAALARTPEEGWSGDVALTLPLPPSGEPGHPTAPVATQVLAAEVVHGDSGWRADLRPTAVHLTPETTLTFSGTATPAGYSLRAAGLGSPADLAQLAERLPPLADGLTSVFGKTPSKEPVKLDLICSRGWTSAAGDQTCAAARAAEPARRSTRRHR